MLNTDGQSNQKPTKLPPCCRHVQAFRILSWNSASLHPFSSTIQVHTVPQVRRSIGHFEDSSPLLWNPRYFDKGDLPEHFAGSFSSQVAMPFSHDSEPEHTKFMTSQWDLVLTDNQLIVVVFYQQLLPWQGLNKPRGEPTSSSRGHFTRCPPRPVSSA